MMHVLWQASLFFVHYVINEETFSRSDYKHILAKQHQICLKNLEL